MKLNTLERLLHVAGIESALAIVNWPVFSVTSFELVRRLRSADIRPSFIIDVGANIGQFATAAAEMLKPTQILCFEPQGDCFRALTSKLSDRYPNILFENFALGDTPGRLEMMVNAHRHSSSFLKLNQRHLDAFPDAVEEGKESIEVKTLDQFFSARDLSSNAMLKLDVQGYEANVLRGGSETLRRIKWVLVEGSFELLYDGEPMFHELYDLLNGLGFEFLRPVSWLEDGKGSIIQMDALFRNREIISD